MVIPSSRSLRSLCNPPSLVAAACFSAFAAPAQQWLRGRASEMGISRSCKVYMVGLLRKQTPISTLTKPCPLPAQQSTVIHQLHGRAPQALWPSCSFDITLLQQEGDAPQRSLPQPPTLPRCAAYAHEQTRQSITTESAEEQTQGRICEGAASALLLFACSAPGSVQGPIPLSYHHLVPACPLLPSGSSVRSCATSVFLPTCAVQPCCCCCPPLHAPASP